MDAHQPLFDKSLSDIGNSSNSHHDATNTGKFAVIFHGSGKEYFKIWIVNLLLSIITLGIYSAWATVRRRRYFYGNTEIAGHRFDYHAKPLQILIGRIIAVVLLLLFAFLYSMWLPPYASGLLFIAAILTLPWIVLRSWRFNAVMSSFSGIRFNYHCRFAKAYWVILLCPLLLFIGALTLSIGAAVIAGLALAITSAIELLLHPFTLLLGFTIFTLLGSTFYGITAKMHADLLINQYLYGNSPFVATLSKRKMITISLISAIILLPFIGLSIYNTLMLVNDINTQYQLADDPLSDIDDVPAMSNFLSSLAVYLGIWISSCYMIAARRNYLFSQTQIGGFAQLHSNVRLLSYMGLLLTNLLLIIFTLGLGIPFAQIRHARFMANATQVSGDLSLDQVRGHQQSGGSAIAEQVAQAFDINLGI